MQTISATDLARHTRDILDKVASQGATLTIERNNTMVAQISPAPRTMTARDVLASLSLPKLTPTQAEAWLKDSKANFGNTVNDPWA
jgi:antitoxin (DNA-binding transcriptional repressor) of toxin-antitoxin stability system